MEYGRGDIPCLAKVEWLFPLAVDVTTRMRHLSLINSFDALQPFGHCLHQRSPVTVYMITLYLEYTTVGEEREKMNKIRAMYANAPITFVY